MWKGEGGGEEESIFVALRLKRRALLASAAAAAVGRNAAREAFKYGWDESTTRLIDAEIS